MSFRIQRAVSRVFLAVDEGAEEVVVVVVVMGQCNRLCASFLPDWCWLWEDTGSFFYGRREAGGRWTYTEVKERRNKCVAFERSMTGSDWLDWEMSL